MWIFLRYFTLFFLLASALFASYSARAALYVPALTKLASAATGRDIAFSTFDINILKQEITFKDVSSGNSISAKEVSVTLRLGDYLKHLSHPINLIKRVKFEALNADLTPAQSAPGGELPSGRALPCESPLINTEIVLERSSLYFGKENLKNINVSLSLGATPFIKGGFTYRGIPINAEGEVFQKGGKIFNNLALNADGDVVASATVQGFFSFDDRSLEQEIYFSRLRYKGFNLDNSLAVVNLSGKSLNADYSGDFGKITLNLPQNNSFENMDLSGNIALGKIRKNLNADLKINFVKEGAERFVNVEIEDASFKDFHIGSFSVKAVKNASGLISTECDLKSGLGINVKIHPRGEFDALILENNKRAGGISGNFKTSTLKADIKNFNLTKLQSGTGADNIIHGTMSVYGDLDENGGVVNFDLLNVYSKNIQKTDFHGELSKNSGVWHYTLNNTDKTFTLAADIKNSALVRMDLNFKAINLKNLAAFFKPGINLVSGIAKGQVRYVKGNNIEINLSAVNGFIGKNNYDTLSVKADLSFTEANVEQILLVSKTRRLEASGLVGFTKDTPVSVFNVKAENIILAENITLNSNIVFNGYLNENNTVDGKITSDEINISGFKIKKFHADAFLATKRLRVENITSENSGLTGALSLRGKNLKGNIEFSNMDIEGVYKGLKGSLNAKLALSGRLNNPTAEITAGLKNASYNNVPFTASSKISFKDSKLNLEWANLNGITGAKARRLKIAARGGAFPNADIKITFENISHRTVNRFLGFRGPFEGMLFGLASIKGERKALKVSAQINSKNALIKGVKVNDIKASANFAKDKITLTSAAMKIKDSEIRFKNAAFNMKTGQYSADARLLNLHIGPVETFGNITLTGKMTKRRGGSVYEGRFSANGLWLNQSKVDLLKFNYKFQNRELTFTENKNQPLKVNGKISFKDRITVRDLAVSYKDSSINFASTFEDGNFNVTSKSVNVDLGTIASLTGFQADFTGKANILFVTRGTMGSRHSLSLNFETSGGSVQNVPFDSLVIHLVSENNAAHIKTAKLIKRNGVEAAVRGTFPLILDSSLKSNNEYNISYEVDDTRLSLLQSITDGFIKPKAGTLKLKGEVKGTSGKIKNSALLSVSGGVFNADAYITKIKDLNAEIELENNILTVNRFAARSGSGKFKVTGSVKLTDSLALEEFNLSAFTETKNGVSVTVPELPLPGSKLLLVSYSHGEPTFNLSLKGKAASALLSGNITLEDTRFSYPPPENDSGWSMPDGIAQTRLDLRLDAGKNTKFENSFVNASILGGINLSGTVGDVKVSGIIESDRGNISYLSNNFDIDTAKIEITGGKLFISGEASAQIFTSGESELEVIKLFVDRSDLENLNLHFSSKSDPSLESDRVLARVTRTEQDANRPAGPSMDFLARQQLVRIFQANIAAPIAKNVLRKTGVVDNVRVQFLNQDPVRAVDEREPTVSELLHGTKYSVEKNLTNNLLLGYNLTFDQQDSLGRTQEQKLDLRHEVELMYRLSKYFSLKGSYELESENQFYQPDRRVMLEHRLRFGGGSKKQ
jgi:hypothetical protein